MSAFSNTFVGSKTTLLVLVLLMILTGTRSASAVSQRISSLRVHGARAVSELTVGEWLGLQTGSYWSATAEARGIQRVLSEYQALGYWHVEVQKTNSSPGETGVALRYSVDEGRQARVAIVSFEEDLPFPMKMVESVVEVRPGDPVVRSRLSSDADALLGLFERNGYPFVELTPDILVHPDDLDVNVLWRVEPGQRVSVDGVRFSGLQWTHESVLMREAGLSIGTLYDQRRVDRATRALRRLPWLKDVLQPTIEQDARTGRFMLHYTVEESRSASVEGGVGLVPGIDGSYDWVGRFCFQSDNLAGSGRGASFRWERPDVESSDLEILYREPWLLGQPFDGAIGIAFKQRVGYMEAGVSASVGYRPASDSQVTIDVERQSLRPDSIGAGSFRQGTWSLGGKAILDRLDHPRFPRNGWAADAAVKWDRVKTEDRTFNRGRYEVHSEFYVPSGRRSVVSLSANGSGLAQRGVVGPNALIRVGGSQTIRGYMEEHFLAEHAFWVNLSWMRDLGRGSRAYVFGDSGLLRVPESGWVGAAGYGLGLIVQTRTGLMAVEYGLAKEDAPGQGKIHVRMVW